MFAKIDEASNPIIKNNLSEQGDSTRQYNSIDCQYINLANNQLLLMKSDSSPIQGNTSTLKIFSNSDLNHCLIENTFKGDFMFIGICPDNSILFHNIESGSHELVKINPDTLTIISNQYWQTYGVGIIDNLNIFIIKRDKSEFYTRISNQRHLQLFRWDEKTYVEDKTIKLFTHPKNTTSDMGAIGSLGKSRYFCHIRGHETGEFGILIFEIIKINKENNIYHLKESGLIEPKAHPGSGRASGEIIVLPNGYLLTYHECHHEVQIWDTNTLTCIKEWNWIDIAKPDEMTQNFSVRYCQISPFPDAIHLLILVENKFYLFNIENLTLKNIPMAGLKKYCNRHHLLSNGQVLAFLASSNENTLQISHFDTEEMIYARQRRADYRMSQLICHSFFNSRFPEEITDYICSYAFT